MRHSLVLTLSTLHHPCLPPPKDAPCPRPSPPTLFPKTLARSGAERPNGGRWKGLCSHFSAPVPNRLRGWKLSAVHRCRFHITVMHVFVDMVDVFTWTRKCVIWWRVSPNSSPTSAAIMLQALGQASNICPGNLSRKDWTLFYLPARAILAFTSLWGQTRCCVDWGQDWCLFIRLAWISQSCSH